MRIASSARAFFRSAVLAGWAASCGGTPLPAQKGEVYGATQAIHAGLAGGPQTDQVRPGRGSQAIPSRLDGGPEARQPGPDRGPQAVPPSPDPGPEANANRTDRTDSSHGKPGLRACELPFTPTFQIQGNGATTPMAGRNVTTSGVVIGDFQGPPPALRGFYIQDPEGDGDPATSDGLFVFNGSAASVRLGDLVRVTGVAGEFQGQTQLSRISSIVMCDTGRSVPPTDVRLPFPSDGYLERYEGMLIRLPQTLHVTEHFQLGRFGQVVLSSEGRLPQPTSVALPGEAAARVQAANDRNRILLDDETNSQNPDPIRFGRGGRPLTAANTLRGGDSATGIVGVMTFTWAGNAASGNAWRVRPLGALGGGVPAFRAANRRSNAPPEVGGTLRVGAFNLLNYFNTFSGCARGVGGPPADCRGAGSGSDFERQVRKTLAALAGLDVDIVGLVEVENDGYGQRSALADLTARLAAATGAAWAFLDADEAIGHPNALGTDAIKVGMLYRTDRATPVGRTAVLASRAFVNGGDSIPRNRPSLAQAFEGADGGPVIVTVNHFKAKGSPCSDPDAGDGQGDCSRVRTRAAEALAAWLATDPTGTGAADILLIGDLNAYAMEDPIRVLDAAGFTNLVSAHLGPSAYSYVFDGQWGYLDHALASPSLVPRVTGVAVWHVNADEPSVLDYTTRFKTPRQLRSLYRPDAFRSSDHDPVIVGIEPGRQ